MGIRKRLRSKHMWNRPNTGQCWPLRMQDSRPLRFEIDICVQYRNTHKIESRSYSIGTQENSTN